MKPVTRFSFSALLLCGFLLACERSLDKAHPHQVRAECPAATSPFIYFGEGWLDDGSISPDREINSDADNREILTLLLTFMGEPTLSCGVTDAVEIYRFSYFPSFDPYFAVTVIRRADGYVVVANAYDPTSDEYRRVARPITEAQWRVAKTAIDDLAFWKEPTFGAPTCFGQDNTYYCMPAQLGIDGAIWIFEGRRNGKYHIVDRWSPGGAVERAGKIFLDLAEIEYSPNVLY